MRIKTVFSAHDYACRTDTCGGIQSLTKDFILSTCVTCPARVQDRVCARNIVTVEKKLTELLGTPPTTRKCAYEACDRHVLITAENKDIVTIVCDWCAARAYEANTRGICSKPGCERQAFKNGICQHHYWVNRGGKPCHAKGCKNKAQVHGWCKTHAQERADRLKIPKGHSIGSFGFDVFAR
jgi:hypothetical protein